VSLFELRGAMMRRRGSSISEALLRAVERLLELPSAGADALRGPLALILPEEPRDPLVRLGVFSFPFQDFQESFQRLDDLPRSS